MKNELQIEPDNTAHPGVNESHDALLATDATSTPKMDALLPLSEVAAILSVAPRTVWRLASKGAIAPPIHVAGCARWFPRDLNEYLQRLAAKRDKRRA
jgi:predicted DNA-binding transcriptional regulator AlpA